jgi:WD40 repeat protein
VILVFPLIDFCGSCNTHPPLRCDHPRPVTNMPMGSDWGNGIIDLTLGLDEDDEGLLLSPAIATRPEPHTSGPSNVAVPAARPTNPHVPQTASMTRKLSVSANPPKLQTRNTAPKPKAYDYTANTMGIGSPGYNATASNNGYTWIAARNGGHDNNGADRGMKRRKMSTADGQSHAQVSNDGTSHQNNGLVAHARPAPAPSRIGDSIVSMGGTNKIPSVQYMNAALKMHGATTSMLDQVAPSGPRPLQIGSMSESDGHTTPASSPITSRQLPTTNTAQPSLVSGDARRTDQFSGAYVNHDSDQGMRAERDTWHMSHQHQMPSRAPSKYFSVSSKSPPPNTYFSGPAFVAQDDQDSVMSDASTSGDRQVSWKHVLTSTKVGRESRENTRAITESQPFTPAAPSPTIMAQQPSRQKFPNQFSEEEEHLLIFLKEVKKLKWKDITPAFRRYFPMRNYTALQSRYSTKTNKRDRALDPPVLNLPQEWAREAAIDWSSVHANIPGTRDHAQVAYSRHDAGTSAVIVPKPVRLRQPIEHDYSSGTDSSVRQARPRRAPPVNYDIRRRNRRFEDNADDVNHDEDNVGAFADMDTPLRSESPFGAQPIAPLKAHVVINNPLDIDFDSDDAGIALNADQWLPRQASQKLPYLDVSQLASLQNVPEGWNWDQLMSRDWQGMLLHVDFSPLEVDQVERTIAKICKAPQKPRHSTQKRQIRTVLKMLTESKLLEVAYAIQRRLPARKKDDVAGFLRDAKAGDLAEAPRIIRLSAARPKKANCTVQVDSTLCMLRQRELGSRSRRGCGAASSPLTYQVKNKMMDTLGPMTSWTGASSDIHTVAWSQDGKHFAAGAVAVTDQDSMQYNRPNNLLFGSLPDATIHELAEHSTERGRTETGANSTHAMFASQDPKLYTTVTSVAFAPSGKVMYSAGYDKFVCVWDLASASSQPMLASSFRHKAEVEMMAVSRKHDGILATGAKRNSGSAIKLIRLNEENPSKFTRYNFHSEKATSRSDLRILPQALQFEPRYSDLLLAGFGANVRQDNGFDTTGDLCLWDITTQSQLQIHGSNRNVFDIEFNPNKRHMPLFAAGCVAGANVNRGTRSVIRFYEQRTLDKYTCPLEIECKALDMNDVVWSPQDENLIAAGCTDGCVYVWDLRRFDDPMRVLSHGQSLMPLQDGVPHERTDTGIRFLSWGDNATRLYSGSSDGVVKVWDVTRSEQDTFVKDLISLESGIMAGAFSPDFSKLVLGEVNGSVNVLDVGRDDCTIRDVERLRYVPYKGDQCDRDSITGDPIDNGPTEESGVAEGRYLLQSQQLQVAPMGNLPTQQVLQGPNYAGPFDQGVDARSLRQQALEFQLSLTAQPGPQCSIPTCKDNIVKTTSEEIGDSGRSADRIPHDLRLQWLSIDASAKMMPGKSKCTNCSRPARPLPSDHGPDDAVLCERCSFACFRCGAANAVAPNTETLVCNSCSGVWEIGALGYECAKAPKFRSTNLGVPSLKRFGKDILEELLDDESTTHGDEMNALTDYYYSLAIDRPESPPL